MIDIADLIKYKIPVPLQIQLTGKYGNLFGDALVPFQNQDQQVRRVNLGRQSNPPTTGMLVLAMLKNKENGEIVGTLLKTIDEKRENLVKDMFMLICDLVNSSSDAPDVRIKEAIGALHNYDGQEDLYKLIVSLRMVVAEDIEKLIENARLEAEGIKREVQREREVLNAAKREWEEKISPSLGWANSLGLLNYHVRSSNVPSCIDFGKIVSAIRPYTSSDLLARAFIGASIVSLTKGRLILADGPVGTGKTSMVEKANTQLGAIVDVLPVRPAWIEPADMFGFFDALGEVFRPGPLAEALEYGKKDMDSVHFVVLDEVNIARIENYAADLLSRLERRSKGKLRLWSPTVGKALHGEYEALWALKGHWTEAQENRIRHLDVIRRHPPEMDVPKNLIVVGTLNTDETTHDVSPKVIDRSFVLAFPASDVMAPRSKGAAQVHLSVSAILAMEKHNVQEGQDTWAELVRNVPPELIADLGIGYSYRVRDDVETLGSMLAGMGASRDIAVDIAIFSRVLPRLTFFEQGIEGPKKKSLRTLLDRLNKRPSLQDDRTWKQLYDRLYRQLKETSNGYVRFFKGHSS